MCCWELGRGYALKVVWRQPHDWSRSTLAVRVSRGMKHQAEEPHLKLHVAWDLRAISGLCPSFSIVQSYVRLCAEKTPGLRCLYN